MCGPRDPAAAGARFARSWGRGPTGRAQQGSPVVRTLSKTYSERGLKGKCKVRKDMQMARRHSRRRWNGPCDLARERANPQNHNAGERTALTSHRGGSGSSRKLPTASNRTKRRVFAELSSRRLGERERRQRRVPRSARAIDPSAARQNGAFAPVTRPASKGALVPGDRLQAPSRARRRLP
jgi:hypothetical protein